jgi:hypothetical protein
MKVFKNTQYQYLPSKKFNIYKKKKKKKKKKLDTKISRVCSKDDTHPTLGLLHSKKNHQVPVSYISK